MLPQFEDNSYLFDETEDVEEEQISSVTFRMNEETKTIGGIIDGLEAIAQSIRTRLQVELAAFEIYDETYGVEFVDLLGQPSGLMLVNLKDTITAACLADDRVETVDSFSFTRIDKKSVGVSFLVSTTFGNLHMEEVANLG